MGALLVYDITDEHSFQNLSRWLEDIKNHSNESTVIMLVGNKLDLTDQTPGKRKVFSEVAKNFAQQNNLHFEELSAITGNNVDETFQKLIEGTPSAIATEIYL